jgi:hypothetical protein
MESTKIVDLIKEIQKRKSPKEDEGKWSKQAAGYIYRPETKYHCDECIFAKEDSTKCALFGSVESIKPYGGCNLYIHKDPDSSTAKSIPFLGLITKLEAGYEENKPGFTCGRCEYYLSKGQDCKRVKKESPGDTLGIIDNHGCCNKWEKDSKRGDMKDEQLDKINK